MRIIKSIKVGDTLVPFNPDDNDILLRSGGGDDDIDAQVAITLGDSGLVGLYVEIDILPDIIKSREDTDDGFTATVDGRKVTVALAEVSAEPGESGCVKYVAEGKLVAVCYPGNEWICDSAGEHDFSFFEKEHEKNVYSDKLSEEASAIVAAEFEGFVSSIEAKLKQHFGEIKKFAPNCCLNFMFETDGVLVCAGISQ